ncbi:MAG: hypothetical protein KA734_11295 [Fluviicola sp.]|nr:hypothetical protein [Fluviicola sp.]MBP6272250.1 hypothetical protein [Fluviicola sp.]
MSFFVSVFLKSSSFSEAYANEKHDGKDSPENIRYEWEDEFKVVGDIVLKEVLRNQEFVLAGEMGEDETFSFTISDMMQFQFEGDGEISSLVFSERSVDEYVVDLEKNKLTVYLNDIEDVENPVSGVYIAAADFPKALKG